jgi:hypothetical protein
MWRALKCWVTPVRWGKVTWEGGLTNLCAFYYFSHFTQSKLLLLYICLWWWTSQQTLWFRDLECLRLWPFILFIYFYTCKFYTHAYMCVHIYITYGNLFIYWTFFYSFIYMCIHWVTSPPRPLPLPLLPTPPHFQAESVLPLSLILLKRRHKHN